MINKYFKWIKGDSIGEKVQVREEDAKFIYFQPSGRILREHLPEFLVEVDATEPSTPLFDVSSPDMKMIDPDTRTSNATSIVTTSNITNAKIYKLIEAFSDSDMTDCTFSIKLPTNKMIILLSLIDDTLDTNEITKRIIQLQLDKKINDLLNPDGM